MGFISFICSKKVLTFAGGIAAGLILPAALKSKTVHNAAVTVVAKGMSLKDEANVACAKVTEDAQDVYAEAKRKATDGDTV